MNAKLKAQLQELQTKYDGQSRQLTKAKKVIEQFVELARSATVALMSDFETSFIPPRKKSRVNFQQKSDRRYQIQEKNSKSESSSDDDEELDLFNGGSFGNQSALKRYVP